MNGTRVRTAIWAVVGVAVLAVTVNRCAPSEGPERAWSRPGELALTQNPVGPAPRTGWT